MKIQRTGEEEEVGKWGKTWLEYFLDGEWFFRGYTTLCVYGKVLNGGVQLKLSVRIVIRVNKRLLEELYEIL